MKRTKLCFGTAAALAMVCVLVMLHRRAVLGDAINGPSGASRWQVTVLIKGQATESKATLNMALPPDVRKQHIFDERLPNDASVENNKRGGAIARRELCWYREKSNDPQFRLIYSFRGVVGMRHPTTSMRNRTKEIDAPPADGEYLKPSDLIECLHEKISNTAQGQCLEGMAPVDQVRRLFNLVREMETQPTPGVQSALECLQEEGGNSAGKSRLLTALCRNRGIPARVVTGLFLTANPDQTVHHWVETWVNGQWLAMCPTNGLFGPQRFPKNHLVLHFGDQEWIRGQQVKFAYGVSVKDLGETDGNEQGSSAWKLFWLRLSPYSLGPAEQSLVRFLLLLPLAALIVCFFRIVVGLPTYGTFGPALLGLAFLDLKALPWGLGVFAVIVLVGWGLRRLLDAYRLLMVPRTATLLTMIILVLIFGTIFLSHQGVSLTRYVALFPLIILTHMVERFWTLEAEDGTAMAFKTLVATLVVTVSISLALSGSALMNVLFRYPELLGLVLAAQLLLGRYTGYRISELYRFRDLTQTGISLQAGQA